MGPELRILHVGDVVGPEAAAWLAAGLPGLRRRLEIDVAIINAENAGITADDPGAGFGMPQGIVDALLGSGADVITSGNHGFDAPDAPDAPVVFADPRVLRPLNLPDSYPGAGSATIPVRGTTVTVINLGSPAAGMEHAAPLEYVASRLPLGETTVIDLHGDATWEKMVFAAAMDGRVAAVLGTHTHEPTERLHVLPGGTAFVADVGDDGAVRLPRRLPARPLRVALHRRRPSRARGLRPRRRADGPRRRPAHGAGRP